jgi:nucleotidyltransferase/DNA polymerase involved in DNA repair
MIAVVAIRHFCVAIEQRADPALADTALILTLNRGHTSPMVLDAASPAAMHGIQPGSTLRQALLRCPGAVVRRAMPARYQAALSEVADVLASLTDRVEIDPPPWATGAIGAPNSLVQIVLDLGQVDAAMLPDLTRRIGRTLREQTRLAVGVGVAESRFPATIAARRVRPHHGRIVTPGAAAAFLAPLPLDVLPLPHDHLHWLWQLGIRTIGAFAALPRRAVLAQLGEAACRVHTLAQGNDTTPVARYSPSAWLESTRAFDAAIQDRGVLSAVAAVQAMRLTSRLARSGQAARVISLRMTLDNGATWENRTVCTPPVSSGAELRDALTTLVAQARIPCGVITITSRLGELTAVWAQQLDLGLFPGSRSTTLEASMQDLVARFGADSVLRVAHNERAAAEPDQAFVYQHLDGMPARTQRAMCRVRVRWHSAGVPHAIAWDGRSHRVGRIVMRWRIDTGWWQVRICRDFFRLTTMTGLLITVVHDLLTDQWYLEAIHD